MQLQPETQQQCEPTIVARALRQQQVRAEVRLEAMQLMMDLLNVDGSASSPCAPASDSHNSDVNAGASHSAAITSVMTQSQVLLPSAHLQLLIGCFGLRQLPTDQGESQFVLPHYQVN